MKSEIQIIDMFKDSVSSVEIANESKQIIAASIDGCIRSFDLRYGKAYVDHIARLKFPFQ